MKKYLYLLTFIFLIYGSVQIIYGQSKSPRVNRKAVKKAISQINYECLPAEIKLDTIVSAIRKTSDLRGKVEFETVRQRLGKLNAKCQNGKMVDGKNREIRFYRLQGCWGNPPPDYREILNSQREELAELKKKYTVVEITCNPSGEMPF